MNKKRLFIGIKIDISKELKDFIINLKKEFNNEKFKWVDYKNFHITLKFLGDTEERFIPHISKALKMSAESNSKFTLQLKGIGVFKKIANPRVLWIGIEKNEKMINLFNSIEDNLEILGIQKEKREFNPHLTISRIKFLKNKKGLLNHILKNTNKEWDKIEVAKFTLYESILKKQGPTYLEVENFNL